MGSGINNKIDKVKIIQLPKIEDDRGNLSFIESNEHIPFKIKRNSSLLFINNGNDNKSKSD